jgi:hypothetical protein
MYSWDHNGKTTREYIKDMNQRVDKLEVIVFELLKELGYAATFSDTSPSFPEIKKVKE